MFDLKHITKSYDDHLVLDDISLSVNIGEVVALIGENGSGKTTLLRVLAGEVKPDGGQVILDNRKIGYVPQEMPLGRTIQESFSHDIDRWRIDIALNEVGLEMPLTTYVSDLSGGQKTRLSLAVIVASNPTPSMLLLDEPTNNLDTDGLDWLEGLIKSFYGSVLLVSHDRSFINKVANNIVEINRGKVRQYGGNYDFYKQQKAVEKQTELSDYQKQINQKKHLEKQFKAAQSRAKFGLKNEQKDNDKMAYDSHQDSVQKTFSGQARAIKTKLGRLEELKKPEQPKDFSISLAGQVPFSKLVLQLVGVEFSYSHDAISLLNMINIEIRGCQRMVINGKNGAGKSTLLKIAAGLIQPDRGEVIIGKDVKVGYFSQDIEGLDMLANMIENLPNHDLTSIYNLANIMGIRHDDVKKPVANLSRGQQAKLGISRLLSSEHQLLILDEPTNHLDIKSREYIERALQRYEGAVLCASHDEYFINQLGVTDSYRLD